MAAACAAVVACDPIYLVEPRWEEVGTLHEGDIVASETWRAAGNPHRIPGHLTVSGPDTAVLTLEPGVRVLMGAGASIQIGSSAGAGAIEAVGRRGDRIEFLSEREYRSPGYWKGINIRPQAVASRLEHVTIRDCGGGDSWIEACLLITGEDAGGPPVLRHVSVYDSKSYGIAGIFGGAFGEGSEELDVRYAVDAVIRVDPDQAGTIPSSTTFQGDGDQGMAVQIYSGTVTRSQSWPKLDVPYLLTRDVAVEGPDAPVLRLSPGTDLVMGVGVVLRVGPSQPGGLVAAGTEEAPIRFMGQTREPGSWKGLLFHGSALPESRLHYAVVAHGGSSTGVGEGNITFVRDLGPVIQQSLIRDSGGCGVVRLLFDDDWATDFRSPHLGNTFRDNAEGPQCTHE
jgi:hypothetical protein